MAGFGVHPGDDLLAIGGSFLAVILIQRSALVERARRHLEFEHFAYEGT